MVQKLIPAVYFWIYSFCLDDHQRSPAQLTGVADELHLICNTTHAVFLLLELDKSAHHRLKPVSALPVKVKLRNDDLLNREPVQTSCPWITGWSTARAHDIRAKNTNQCSVRIELSSTESNPSTLAPSCFDICHHKAFLCKYVDKNKREYRIKEQNKRWSVSRLWRVLDDDAGSLLRSASINVSEWS